MPTGYGVETAHLLDVHRTCGISAIAQTDLDERIHRNRSLAQLGRMSGEILDAFFSRAGSGGLPAGRPELERPPMISLPDYRERFP
jgi:glucosyl-3-phosphoglycerate synthase